MTQPQDPFTPPSSGPYSAAPPPQWATPPAYGWAPQRGTNGLAVAAFVLAFVFFPVGFVLGIVALSQIRRTGEDGRGLAIGAVVVSSVVGLLVVALIGLFVVLGVSGAFDETTTGRVAQAGSTTVGACLRSTSEAGGISRAVSCEVSHDQEVYAVEVVGAGNYPGDQEVQDSADQICLAAFEGYVGTGYDNSDHDYDYYAPDAAEWAAEERRVVCVIVPGGGGSFHRSVRDTEN